MPRLIDADELKTAFPCGESIRTESVRATIDHMATVEAEPVRHGRWIKEINPMKYQLRPYVWACDQCGTAFYYNTPYCGGCGAVMDGVEDAETN